MPASISDGISLLSAAALRRSDTVTCAPRRRRKRAAARPDLPSPTTNIFLPFTSMQPSHPRGNWSSQLQGSERKQRKHQSADPEADDNFRLRPAHQLEMMV